MIWTLEGQVACWKLVNDNGKVLLGVSVCLVHWNNPLQCSCLENPRDEGAWWAAIYGVAQSLTWLKQLRAEAAAAETFNHMCGALYGLSSRLTGKESACQCRRHKRWGFNPWSGRSPGRENGNPLQDSCLENPMDRGAWWAIVHRTEHMEPYSQRLPIFFYKLVNFKNITYFMAK